MIAWLKSLFARPVGPAPALYGYGSFMPLRGSTPLPEHRPQTA
jgi:hypothetical protein